MLSGYSCCNGNVRPIDFYLRTPKSYSTINKNVYLADIGC